MGQLFCESGYETVFVDVRPDVVAALNERRGYRLHLAADPPQSVWVGPVRAIDGRDAVLVAATVQQADVLCTAVGADALPAVCEAMAPGLAARRTPVNLIVCENLPQPAAIVQNLLLSACPPLAGILGRTIGVVEAVVGRVVPLQPTGEEGLDLTVEPYKHLPVNARGLVRPMDDIAGIEPRQPFEAYVARKLFVHNAGHASAAYLAYRQGIRTIPEAMQQDGIAGLVDQLMQETGDALVLAFGLDASEMGVYRKELLRRFANVALRDTVARVGRDPIRKLGPEERLIGGAQCAIQAGGEPRALVQAICAALRYDEPADPSAIRLQALMQAQSLAQVLTEVCGLAPGDPLAQRIQAAWQVNGQRC